MIRHYDRRGDAARLRYLEEDFEYAGFASISNSGRGLGRIGQSRGAALRLGDERYRRMQPYYDVRDYDSDDTSADTPWQGHTAEGERHYRERAERAAAEHAAYVEGLRASEAAGAAQASAMHPASSRAGRRPRRERIYPKGYVRSDERIREDLCEALGDSGLDVSNVTVMVKDGVVTLDGTVTQRGVKHAIEDYADDCGGVKEIINNIRVVASH